MRAQLERSYRFEAAHYLPKVPAGHKCARMHGHSYAITVVIDRPTAVQHHRLHWVIGDARAPETIARVDELTEARKGMVIEDSDHKEHVTLALLEEYSRFVAPGCYFIVEDTIVEALQIPPFPGPLNAVRDFVARRGGEFVIDRAREKFIMTNNPMGYLLRATD